MLMFEVEDEGSKWTQNYQQIIQDYPFYNIPIGIIRNPTKFNLPTEQTKKLVAFKAINARAEDVNLAIQYLMPGENMKVDDGR